jgi:N-methylhydantoinase A
MTRYIDDLDQRLRDEGFTGRLLMLTSAGGVQDARHVAQAPIHTIGSGPAAAPVAGRQFAMRDAKAETAIVTDAGGTTFDVSLIRGGHIPWTRETMVGHPKLGYLTGFPSIDVRSIGAGGGSIAWVDEGGLLHVGPESAGAVPGPACYGRGGMRPTVTDACVVLGYIDPDFFLGGAMPLAAQLASDAIEQQIGQPLGLGLFEAASATLDLACERMVNAIEEITLLQGVDPRQAVVVAGGGGAGLYAVTIARRLKAESVVIPNVAAALSATGALLSDLKSEYAKAAFTTTAAFDYSLVNATLSELKDLCRGFLAGPASDVDGASTIHFAVEARYADQVWEIEVPLKVVSFDGEDDVKQLERDFHHAHEQLFAVRDAASTIEIVSWRARVSAQLRDDEWRHEDLRADGSRGPRTRSAYFSGVGLVETDVRRTEQLRHREILTGPAVIESEAQTVVVPPGSTVELLPSGSLLLHPLEVTGSTLTPGSFEGVSA